jgi:hypothetical protein
VHQPLVLTEFGGLSSSSTPGEWGYLQVESDQALRDGYRTLLETVRSLQVFAGFCYTQFADTYQETNGLLHGDRTPKFPLAEIHAATSGLSTSSVAAEPAGSSPRQLPPTDTGEGGG